MSFTVRGTRDGVFVEVAMQHNDSYTENIYTFVNNVNTPEGGTHLARPEKCPDKDDQRLRPQE